MEAIWLANYTALTESSGFKLRLCCIKTTCPASIEGAHPTSQSISINNISLHLSHRLTLWYLRKRFSTLHATFYLHIPGRKLKPTEALFVAPELICWHSRKCPDVTHCPWCFCCCSAFLINSLFRSIMSTMKETN